MCRSHTLLLLNRTIIITQLAYCRHRLHGALQPGVLEDSTRHSLGKGVQAGMNKLRGLLQLALLGQEMAALDQRLKLPLSPENARKHHLLCTTGGAIPSEWRCTSGDVNLSPKLL